MSEDFDMVVDSRELDLIPSYSGIDGQFCLNEKRVSDKINYGICHLEKNSLENKNNLVILNDFTKNKFIEDYFGNGLSSSESVTFVSSSLFGNNLYALEETANKKFEDTTQLG